MKSKIFCFTGIGFLGLNLLKYFIKDNCKIIGIKKNFPFKFVIKNEKKYIFINNIFNTKQSQKLELKNSIIILSILDFKNKLFKNQFNELIKFFKEKKIKKLILISSVSVYKNNNSNKVQTLNEYSKKCLLAEKICKKYFKKCIILRVSNLFGILRPDPGTIEKMMMEYLDIKKFIFYKKEITRSYIPINELCSILKKIIMIKNFSGIYNISNKNFIFTFKKLEEEFTKKFKKNRLLKKVNLKPFITRSVIDNKKIMKRINYKQSVNFRNELNNIEKFYKNYFIKGKTYYIN